MKPENMLIRSNGAVKVLDFGLAMFDENDEEFAMAMIYGQDRLGTADFVAPEQTLNSYRVDRRADVYGLGCTLFYLLTGQVPFPADTSKEKIKMHRQQAPPKIRDLRPEVPKKVELIVRKMMTKRVENRIQSCEEVAQYLEPFCDRQEVAFDFPTVLRARVNQARLRVSRRRKSQKHLTGLSAMVQAEAALDTKIREETKTPLENDKFGPGNKPES
jgi:serine/threonine-protein kinase